MSPPAMMRTADPPLPTPEESELAKASGRLLAQCIGTAPTVGLRAADGDGDLIDVPVRALRMLVHILGQLAEGNGVTVLPTHAMLTTQQAADCLNVSRPFVVKLIEQRELPFERVGTHRRIRFEDVVAYRRRSRATNEQAPEDPAVRGQADGLESRRTRA